MFIGQQLQSPVWLVWSEASEGQHHRAHIDEPLSWWRAKAAEYDGRLGAAQLPAEATEYRHLKQSYKSLAENLYWVAANAGKTVGSGARVPT